ncbi:hypothetical protein JCM11641_006761 [Rhodosporidiobolus odoratus]
MQNIVVVGFGPAAAIAVKALLPSLPETHRVVVVTATEGYWPIASLRAAVVPGWEEKVIAPVDNALPLSPRVVMLKSTCVIEFKLDSVMVDKPHPELGAEIPFDYAILATGSSYPFPCRPLPGATYAETVASLRQSQTDIAAASSILVIGGGPVGIEIAGEIASHYKGDKAKNITLVHSHDKFLHEEGWKDKFNASMEKQLKDLGVKVVLNAKVVGKFETGPVEGGEQEFKLSNGEKVKANYVFVAHGNAPNSGIIGAFDPSLLNEHKQVKVKPSLQLASTDGKYDHIFAAGDVTDVPESKLFAHAQNHGPILAKNLAALIKAGGPTKTAAPLKTYGAGGKMIAICIGPNGGASQFFGFFMGPWLTSFAKSKSLFLSNFDKMYSKA